MDGSGLELVGGWVTWLRTALSRPVFTFFQIRSATTELQKGENLVKNSSFSDAI